MVSVIPPALFLFLLFLVLFWTAINNPTIRLMMIGYTALYVCDVTVKDGAMNAISSFRVPLRSNIGFIFVRYPSDCNEF